MLTRQRALVIRFSFALLGPRRGGINALARSLNVRLTRERGERRAREEKLMLHCSHRSTVYAVRVYQNRLLPNVGMYSVGIHLYVCTHSNGFFSSLSLNSLVNGNEAK